MFTRVARLKESLPYHEWIKENNFSVASPKHRRYYAEYLFHSFCQEQGIITISLNPILPALLQIPAEKIQKNQQKILQKFGRISFDFYCINKENGFFTILKMGTSSLSKQQRIHSSLLKNVYLFHAFEDTELVIKRLDKK